MIIHNKTASFTCKVCGQPGQGAPNAIVHPGECRRVWQDRITYRSRYRWTPKRKGLWVAVVFQNGDTIEGVIPNDLLHLDIKKGIDLLTPGEGKSVHIDRKEMEVLVVLSVIGGKRYQSAVTNPQLTGKSSERC